MRRKGGGAFGQRLLRTLPPSIETVEGLRFGLNLPPPPRPHPRRAKPLADVPRRLRSKLRLKLAGDGMNPGLGPSWISYKGHFSSAKQ